MLKHAGYALQRYDSAAHGKDCADQIHRISEYTRLLGKCAEFIDKQTLIHIVNMLASLRSQIGQDLFCLIMSEFKRGGFFVEFGAADGVSASNTYILEKDFGWKGIVAEPARGWHEALHKNRSCDIETSCVWRTSGETLLFNEVPHGFGTIADFSAADKWAAVRRRGSVYSVPTISLQDMLVKHGAPPVIDYISIDTEGSEFAILNNFDLSRWRFKLITVEHNYTPNREHLSNLLASAGYTRVKHVDTRFDDWYVEKDLIQNKQFVGFIDT